MFPELKPQAEIDYYLTNRTELPIFAQPLARPAVRAEGVAMMFVLLQVILTFWIASN